MHSATSVGYIRVTWIKMQRTKPALWVWLSNFMYKIPSKLVKNNSIQDCNQSLKNVPYWKKLCNFSEIFIKNLLLMYLSSIEIGIKATKKDNLDMNGP